MLNEEDDLVRARDMPERMQLASSTLYLPASLHSLEPFSKSECVEAASWVTPRLGAAKERDFFKSDGRHHFLLGQLVESVTQVIEYLFVQQLEVPYIYAHRRDYISYFNLKDFRAPRVELLNQEDLWRIHALGKKYRSLLDRQKALQSIYEQRGIKDEYYEEHLKTSMDSLDAVMDITQWLDLRYKEPKNKLNFPFDDDIDQAETKKHKLPSRVSAYELAKKSVVAKLADVSKNFFFLKKVDLSLIRICRNLALNLIRLS